MRTIFETCRPREEVLKGELTDEMFAARLKDVVEGTADPVYGAAARFFDNTFFTSRPIPAADREPTRGRGRKGVWRAGGREGQPGRANGFRQHGQNCCLAAAEKSA